ncbi:ABC-2 family transporter protein [Aerococcaceae bacterium zg-ZJ1578]|uniref:ABC transporter permease n=1 Tax=Aerococcaceae bacterium zg-252 TaxID=2796928 RepID=UPI001A326C42|nr:ABC-2 family transporter protein [Aerococcaceae bacterium zg-1578]
MFEKIRFHASIYKHFIKTDMKRIQLYPIDFLLGNLGFFLDTVSNLFVLYIIMSTTKILGEFNGYQMLFFYGFLMLSGALFEILFVTILEVPYMIRTGELDIFLLRPLNILFQFIVFQLDEESIFEAIFAVGVLIFSIAQMELSWNIVFLTKLIGYLISSVFVRCAIYLFLSSLSFWWISNEGLKSIIWEISQLGSYPLSIYPNVLRIILIAIPFSFVGYFPVKDLLLSNTLYGISSFINFFAGLVIFSLVYVTFWRLGLRKYTSAGG